MGQEIDLEKPADAPPQILGPRVDPRLLADPAAVTDEVLAELIAAQPVGDPGAAPLPDTMAEARQRLIVHRRQVDEGVRQRQAAEVRRHHRQAGLWSAALVALGTAPAAGPILAAGLGVWSFLWLIRLRSWLDAPFSWTVTALIVPAWTASAVGLVGGGGTTAQRVVGGLLAAIVGLSPWLHR